MRIAIVHDWLPLIGGAERVLEQMLQVFPGADLFSLLDLIPPHQRGFLLNKPVKTSFVQKLPWVKEHYRSYLPLMPLAVEQFDLSSYDLILSSSYAVAKGVLTSPDQLHICYCHSPIRYAWDLQSEYLAASGLASGIRTWLVRALLHYIRMWDVRTANGVNHFIANSRFIARRIQKVYGRQATVIHPPVDTQRFQPSLERQDFYFTASRLVPYKRVDLIVKAFAAMPDKQLVVVGDGPEMAKVRALAGPNVRLLGAQPQGELIRLMQSARAFVFAAKEDFGIVPVEGQACGTPVIAYGHGGVTESIIHGKTGIFFDEQSVESVVRAVKAFEECSFDPRVIRLNAERFSADRFRHELKTFVTTKWAEERTIATHPSLEADSGGLVRDVEVFPARPLEYVEPQHA